MRPLILLGVLCLAAPAFADKLVWDYDTTKGTVPTTVTVKKGPSSTGPWTVVATIPAVPATYTMPAPADNQWYTIGTPGGNSNSIIYTALPTTTTYDDTALKAAITDLSARLTILETRPPDDDTGLIADTLALKGRADTLDAKLAGICKAAKAMGGSAVSFAGRLRKEIPCP